MNADVLFNILLSSDIDNIKILCQINQNAYKICNDKFFWVTKYTDNNIPYISDLPVDNHLHWIQNYKNIKSTKKIIDNIIMVAENEKCLSLTDGIIDVGVEERSVLHLLPPILSIQIQNHIDNFEHIKSEYQGLKINLLDNNEYSISYTLYYDYVDENYMGDEFIFTMITAKKDVIHLLTKILYLYSDINLTDTYRLDSYILEYIYSNINEIGKYGIPDPNRYKKLKDRLYIIYNMVHIQ